MEANSVGGQVRLRRRPVGGVANSSPAPSPGRVAAAAAPGAGVDSPQPSSRPAMQTNCNINSCGGGGAWRGGRLARPGGPSSRPVMQTNCKHFCSCLGPYIHSRGGGGARRWGRLGRSARKRLSSVSHPLRTLGYPFSTLSSSQQNSRSTRPIHSKASLIRFSSASDLEFFSTELKVDSPNPRPTHSGRGRAPTRVEAGRTRASAGVVDASPGQACGEASAGVKY